VSAELQAQAQSSRASARIGSHLRSALALTPATQRDPGEEPPTTHANPGEVIALTVKDINKQRAAHISWSRTADRNARTRPAREAFLRRFEREVDPDTVLPPAERRLRAQHALRAHMLGLAKRSAAARVRVAAAEQQPPPASAQ
jgi:hypothetical protein